MGAKAIAGLPCHDPPCQVTAPRRMGIWLSVIKHSNLKVRNQVLPYCLLQLEKMLGEGGVGEILNIRKFY